MNVSILGFVIMSAATVANMAIIVLLLTGKKYERLLEPLDGQEYILKDAYGIGLRLLELKKEKYCSKWYAKQEEYLEILYGKKYVPYYLRIYCARRATLTVVIFAIMLNMSAMAGGNMATLLVLSAVMTWAVHQKYTDELKQKIEERADQMTAELPEAVGRLALLINAGMILREAWEVVADSMDSLLYQEMRLAHEHMRNGMSESDCIFLFGRRSENSEVRKFASQLIQAIEKDGSRLSAELAQLSGEMLELKRQYVFRRADASATKLLVPMFIMFVGILILIAGPILSNM